MKNFEDMTLDEIFAFEAIHPFIIGRSVVSKTGWQRHQSETANTLSGLGKEKKKRRAAKTATR